MGVIYWPMMFAPAGISANVNPRNVRGSTALSGHTQVVGSRNALWEVRFMDLFVRPENVLLWRALQYHAMGMIHPLVIPLLEGYRIPQRIGAPPRDVWSNPDMPEPVPHSDASLFSDQSGYYQPSNSAVLASALARGASSAVIDMRGSALHVGHYFSIGDRAYVVRKIDEVAGSVHSIQFAPTARETAPAGASVEFDRPRLKVRLRSDAEMSLDLTMGRYGRRDIQFVEDLS